LRGDDLAGLCAATVENAGRFLSVDRP